MVDSLLRPVKDRFLNPLARALKLVPATVLSLIGFSCGLAAIALVVLGHPIAACTLWLLNRLFDGLDGAVARLNGTATDLGGYLDIVLDTIIYAGLPIGVALGSPSHAALVAALALLAALYVNGATWMFLAAILEKRHAGATSTGEATTITMPRGLVEGAEAVVLYSALLLFPALAVALLWGFASLVVLTAAHRFARAARVLRSSTTQ